MEKKTATENTDPREIAEAASHRAGITEKLAKVRENIPKNIPKKHKGKRREGKNLKSQNSNIKQTANIAAMLKQMAFEGKTIAEAEAALLIEDLRLKNEDCKKIKSATEITENTEIKNKKNQRKSAESAIKSLNDLFEKKPELKAAFERGRFLKNLSECAASGATIADAEHDLDMQIGELDKILAADTEAADVWNQSIRKTLNRLRRQMLDKVNEASVPALKLMYSMLRKQIVAAPADITHLTWLQIAEVTGGKSRMTVQSDWPTKYGCPRNSDGTYNLKDFMPWYLKFEIEKLTPGKPAEMNSLQEMKAKEKALELAEKSGNLLPRAKVITGLIARNQTLIGVFSKFIGGETEPFVKQRLEKIYEDIRRELAGNIFDMKLDERQQELLKELLIADCADSTDIKATNEHE